MEPPANRIWAEDRASFRRCGRQWDFGAGLRRNLVAAAPAPPDLDTAIREALAVYYFPGMWDWQRQTVLPLVLAAFRDAMRVDAEAKLAASLRRARDRALRRGEAMLDSYFAWAPKVDRISPVRVETDLEARIPDPQDPERTLETRHGRELLYCDRAALVAVDEHDEYWVATHRVVDRAWGDVEELWRDEEAVARCWAWESVYPGIEIAGTIHNELRVSAAGSRRGAARGARREDPRGPSKREPSSGGRSTPQRRRTRARTPASPFEPVRCEQQSGFRRTWIRRERSQIVAAGAALARDALEMLAAPAALPPNPAEHCARCLFAAPCDAIERGADPDAALAGDFRVAAPRERGRRRSRIWSVGRGAAPPGVGSLRARRPR